MLSGRCASKISQSGETTRRSADVRNEFSNTLYPAWEGVFWGAAAAAVPVPDFPCFVFGGVFLNRMRTPKENRARMPDLARFGKDADRGRPAADETPAHSV